MAGAGARSVREHGTKDKRHQTETSERATRLCTLLSVRTRRCRFPSMGFRSAQCSQQLGHGSLMFPRLNTHHRTIETRQNVACRLDRYDEAQMGAHLVAASAILRSTFDYERVGKDHP